MHPGFSGLSTPSGQVSRLFLTVTTHHETGGSMGQTTSTGGVIKYIFTGVNGLKIRYCAAGDRLKCHYPAKDETEMT